MDTRHSDNLRRRLLISNHEHCGAAGSARADVNSVPLLHRDLGFFFFLFSKLGARMTFKGTYSCANQDIRALARGSFSAGSRLCSRLRVFSVLSTLTAVRGEELKKNAYSCLACFCVQASDWRKEIRAEHGKIPFGVGWVAEDAVMKPWVWDGLWSWRLI